MWVIESRAIGLHQLFGMLAVKGRPTVAVLGDGHNAAAIVARDQASGAGAAAA